MSARLDPYAVSPGTMQELISFQEFRCVAELDDALVEMLRARVSQINGCLQGVHRHMRVARQLGETNERLACLVIWRNMPFYTERERAALEWTEAVTLVAQSHISDRVFEATRQWFTELEMVSLTMIVAATNAWNRVELSFWKQPIA